MKKFVIFLIVLSFILCSCSTQKSSFTSGEIENLSRKKYEWGFKKNPGKKPDVDSSAVNILEKYGGYYIGDSSAKNVYLTFDEGYENGYTAQILDTLKNHGVPACFFVTGPYLETESELVLRMANEGHEVGNHTVNHPSMPDISSEKEFEDELLALDMSFYAQTGKHMKFLRPPKGEFSEQSAAVSENLGYTTVLWSLAYPDWDVKNQPDVDTVYHCVMDYLHDGAIILMHAVSKSNAEALDRMLTDAKAAGYVFKPLSELGGNS